MDASPNRTKGAAMEMSSRTHGRLRRVIVTPIALAAVFTATGAAADIDPYINLSKQSGPPGTVTEAKACGFSANQPIKVSAEGSSQVTDIGSIRSDNKGCAAMSLRVPESAKPGTMVIHLRQGERVATTNFDVKAS
jgi:hypothetical protein